MSRYATKKYRSFVGAEMLHNQAKEAGLMFTKTEVGRQIYVWSVNGKKTTNTAVVISAHGMQTIINSRHTLPRNLKNIVFYAPHGTNLRDPLLENIIAGKVLPAEISKGDTQDYHLTKYQGTHNGVGETYEEISRYNENAPMDVITIRNRNLSNALTMRQVISQVVADGWPYLEFHCAFCRGSAVPWTKADAWNAATAIPTLSMGDL